MSAHRWMGLGIMVLALLWAGLTFIMIVQQVQRQPQAWAYAWLPLLLPGTLFLWGLGVWFRKGLVTCGILTGAYGCFVVVGVVLFIVLLALNPPLFLPLDFDLNFTCNVAFLPLVLGGWVLQRRWRSRE